MFKKITNFLYLGDMNSQPKFCDFEVSVANQLFLPNDNSSNNFYNLLANKIYFNFDSFVVDKYQIKFIVDFIFKKAKTNIIYLHCQFGVNRSPFITFIFLVRYNYLQAKNYKEALTKFRGIYPFIGLGFNFLRFIKKNYPFKNL